MGIFLNSERKVYSNTVRTRGTQESAFPPFSHSQVVPKIDFPSHKLSEALMKDALTEVSIFTHALQRDCKTWTPLLHASNATFPL